MRQIAFCRLWYHIAKCAADAKSVTYLAKYIINETEMQESVREAANCREPLGCLRVILGCLCDRKLYVPVFYIRKFVSRSSITGCYEREYVRPRRHIIEYIGAGGARLFSPRNLYARAAARQLFIIIGAWYQKISVRLIKVPLMVLCVLYCKCRIKRRGQDRCTKERCMIRCDQTDVFWTRKRQA